MEYMLVIFIYAGIFAKGDSVAVTTINGWQNEEACIAAGKKIQPLASSTTKEIKFVCIKR